MRRKMRPNVDVADDCALVQVINETTYDSALHRRRGVIHIRYMLTFEKTYVFSTYSLYYISAFCRTG
jgi:hypothetical protein